MLNLIIIAAFARLALAQQFPARGCAALLGVPTRFEHLFTEYVNPVYLTPLGHVEVNEAGLYTEFILSSESNEEYDDPLAYRVYARVRSDSSETPRELAFEELSLPDQVEPAFAYRALLSHVLNRFPEVARVELDLYRLPDFGRARGLLAKGASLESAVRDADAYRAFAAYGFQFADARAEFMNPAPPRELVLRLTVMR